jgi:hypothetical protein
MNFIRFFYPGHPGFLLVIAGSVLGIAFLVNVAHDKDQALHASKQVTRDLGKVNPSEQVDKSVAQKETVLSSRRLVPGANSEPENTPIKNQVFMIPTRPQALPTLVSFYTSVPSPTPVPTPKEQPVTPQYWLPPVTLIPCALVNTVDSSHMNTPVIGEVTRDCWERGKLIIPAGTIVSSFANETVRDRIEVAGVWLFVFPDGKQLKVPGMALVREADPTNQQFGPEDGSAGLAGVITESDHWSNAKAFLGLLMMSTTQVATSAANSVLNRGFSGGTVLPDTSQIEAKYLDQLLNGQTGDGRYVHVPGGTEFYFFCSDTVLPKNRQIVNNATMTTDIPEHSDNPMIQAEREIMRGVQPQTQPTTNDANKFRY